MKAASRIAGVYTAIISTFEPGKTGTFDLSLESTLPITLTTIPQEGAGMHQRLLTGAW
jgi:calpain-7